MYSKRSTAIRGAKNYLEYIYTQIIRGLTEDETVIELFANMISKFNSIHQTFGQFNIDTSKFDFILKKMTEIFDKHSTSIEKYRLNQARNLRDSGILGKTREKRKYDNNHPIIKMYYELTAKHSVECCGILFKSQRNMMRHIEDTHPYIFDRSTDKSSLLVQEIDPEEPSTDSPAITASNLPSSSDLTIPSTDKSSLLVQEIDPEEPLADLPAITALNTPFSSDFAQ